METIKILLKNSPDGSIRASFYFVNMRKRAGQGSGKSAKGHLSHRLNFYFESCVCQKKRTKYCISADLTPTGIVKIFLCRITHFYIKTTVCRFVKTSKKRHFIGVF